MGGSGLMVTDSEYIESCRQADLQGAVRGLRSLHRKKIQRKEIDPDYYICEEDQQIWPCRTISMLDNFNV